jgi:hypothetical protein
MPSLGVQELLVKQERARIERLSHDAWQHQLSDAPAPATRRVTAWRLRRGRSATADRA